MQSGVRPTIIVFMVTCAIALVLSILLPFETKGRQLAEDDSDLPQDQGANDLFPQASVDTAVDHYGSRKADLQMAAMGSRGVGPVRLNPFHTDDVSSQIADSTVVAGESRTVAGGADSRTPESLERDRN